MLEVFKSNSELTKFNFGDHTESMDDCTRELISCFKESNFYGRFTEWMYEDFKVSHSVITCDKAMKLISGCVDATIEMIFVLHGDLKAILSCPGERQCFKYNTHNLINCPCGRSIIEFGSGKTQIVSIQLTPALFKNFMPSSEVFESFNTLFEKQQSGYLLERNLAISLPIQMILDDIINCPWKGHFRKLFLYSKALELFLLQLKQCRFNGDGCSLSDDDALKIQQAKHYVLNNYNQHITIPGLAKRIGTNEFTLKKGFKELVGTTVFGYINDIKMNKAKQMLTNQNLSISQVSEYIGYKNPQHFSTAFKKKFGIIPSKFKGS